MAVSLRVPEVMKKRIAKLAKAQDMTAHAFMLEAIREKIEAEQARISFRAEGERRLARMKSTGAGIPADEVFAYLERRAKGTTAPRPKARKIQ
jgi:predicted transcriptional regulator